MTTENDQRTIDRERKRGEGWERKNKPGAGRPVRIPGRVDKSIRMPEPAWHFLETRYGGPPGDASPGDMIRDMIAEVRERERLHPRKRANPIATVAGVVFDASTGDVAIRRLERKDGKPWTVAGGGRLAGDRANPENIEAYLGSGVDLVAIETLSLPTDMSRNASAAAGEVRGRVAAVAALLGSDAEEVQRVRMDPEAVASAIEAAGFPEWVHLQGEDDGLQNRALLLAIATVKAKGLA